MPIVGGAVTVARYLDGASSGGDGTTNALSGVHAAYKSFASWQTAEVADLVTAGTNVHQLICSGSGVSEVFTLTGWTTDIDHFVLVTVDAASRHTGIPGTGFKITGTANWSTGLSSVQPYTVVEWLESTTIMNHAKAFYTGSLVLLVGCIGSSQLDLTFFTGDNNPTYVSCLAHGGGSDGFNSSNYDRAIYYNCSSAGNGAKGFNRAGTAGGSPKAINCVSFNNVASDFVSDSGWLAGTDYNASEDFTAPGTTIVTGVVAGDFTDTAANDYSISGTASNLYSAGRSIEPELLALDRTYYTIPRLDLAGNPLSTDIGAFAYVQTSLPFLASFNLDAELTATIARLARGAIEHVRLYSSDNPATTETGAGLVGTPLVALEYGMALSLSEYLMAEIASDLHAVLAGGVEESLYLRAESLIPVTWSGMAQFIFSASAAVEIIQSFGVNAAGAVESSLEVGTSRLIAVEASATIAATELLATEKSADFVKGAGMAAEHMAVLLAEENISAEHIADYFNSLGPQVETLAVVQASSLIPVTWDGVSGFISGISQIFTRGPAGRGTTFAGRGRIAIFPSNRKRN